MERRPPRLTKWTPKKWQPEYEKMVAYSVMGWSNRKIAEALGYTKEHVSNVLNTPQADELKERLMERMRERTMHSIPEALDYVAQKTTTRLKQIVDNDELFEKSPFAVIDRGIKVLEGMSHLRGGGNGSGTINAPGSIILSGVAAENLRAGLKKADEVKLIHAPSGNGTKE